MEEISKGSSMLSERKRKSVSFGTTACIGTAANWLPEDQYNIWFQQCEIEMFKIEARKLMLLLGPHVVVNQFSGDDEHNCTRGLEKSSSLRRIQNKVIAKRVILKSQKRFRDPHKVALVANKCTEWSREIAIISGKIDYHEANNMFLPTQKIPVHPFETKTGAMKRQISEDLFSRVKRRRQTSIAEQLSR